MKTIVRAVVIWAVVSIGVSRGEESFIPAPLNAVLGEIRPRMTASEVEKVLAVSYPKVASQVSLWSGQTGYVDYELDDKLTLTVSSMNSTRGEVVGDRLHFYLRDRNLEQQIEIGRYAHGRSTEGVPRYEFGPEEQPFFEEEKEAAPARRFQEAYGAAQSEVSTATGAEPLIRLLSKFIEPIEQAQLEAAIGGIYGNANGLADPAKSLEHLNKALSYEVRGRTRQELLRMRAGAFEQLGDQHSALQDTLRSLLWCSYFEIAAIPPPAPTSDAIRRFEDRQQYQTAIELEQFLFRLRRASLASIRRMQAKGALDEAGLLKALEEITPDRRKDATILEWLRLDY